MLVTKNTVEVKSNRTILVSLPYDFSHNVLGWITIALPFSAGILISAISSKEIILSKEANPHTAEHKKQEFTCPNKIGLIENCRPIKTIELGSKESVGFETSSFPVIRISY